MPVPLALAEQGASTETQLAALLRLVQWRLDDVAHDLPAGCVTVAKRDELAELLEGVAGLVRAEPTVVERR